ncbi:hypothetical protein EIN_135150 [Entamoeba invadens IP1]|uniref:Atg6 BARA domain-containing protein n=1 Tax=Entamoeba invadens IP1 TaxID=370355 RepID=A0A0A1U0B6_ENTIV|nr:hypothetical protein EIN_135150 [Entamoeba invadens IP1]ELP85931.1 hypothetical protein EIN_135150 [Entamoeba invadens IP1]|eukprot:XP_004185277.1 hypothetical protein EIN_135150 [Entamoeba invadens IP1]
MLYSHIELSKTTNQTLTGDDRDANCSLVGESGFKSTSFLCEECLQLVLQRMDEFMDLEKYHQQKWIELKEELDDVQDDIKDMDVIIKGYECTKLNDENVQKLRDLKEKSFEQMKDLQDEIARFDESCVDNLERKFWIFYNDIFHKVENSLVENIELQRSVLCLKEEVKRSEELCVLGNLFGIECFDDGLVSIGGFKLRYSVECVDEFNMALGKFVMGIYLLGKKVLSENSIVPIPFDDRSQISVRKGEKKTVYNLYLAVQSFYHEVDVSFKEGFKYLVIYFGDIFEKCATVWPKLKEKYHYSVKVTTMCIYDSNMKKSYSLVFDPLKVDEWNRALGGMMKIFNYLLLNYTTLVYVLDNEKHQARPEKGGQEEAK